MTGSSLRCAEERMLAERGACNGVTDWRRVSPAFSGSQGMRLAALFSGGAPKLASTRWSWFALGGATGGDGFGFTTSIAGHVLRKFENDAGRILAELGGVRREPAVD